MGTMHVSCVEFQYPVKFHTTYILHIHWKMQISYNVEILKAMSPYTFLKHLSGPPKHTASGHMTKLGSRDKTLGVGVTPSVRVSKDVLTFRPLFHLRYTLRWVFQCQT